MGRHICARQAHSSRIDVVQMWRANGGLPALAVLGALCLAGCEGHVSTEAAATVERIHQAALVPGYSSFKLLDSSADVGVAIFSYRYPDDLKPDSVLETVRLQIQESDRCYQVAHRTEGEVQLRCFNEDGVGFAEYRVAAQAGRATVMFGDFDSAEEVSAYPEYEAAFRHAAVGLLSTATQN